MGGINSGRRATTPDTDECLRLSLTDLRRDGALKREVWARRERNWTRSWDDAVVGAVTIVTDLNCRQSGLSITIKGNAFGKRIDQDLKVVAQSQPLGGERFYAVCPLSGRRCTALILPPGTNVFASVSGWGIAYASTREHEISRAFRTMRKIERQTLSKYARRSTREHHLMRWMKAADTCDAYVERILQIV